MPTILLIEDRPDHREAVSRLLRMRLKALGDWQVIDSFPFPDLEDYPSYIAENDVSAIVADERLQENSDPTTGLAVAYAGHQLAAHLRALNSQLPVFIVTSHADLEGEDAGQVDQVIKRADLAKNMEIYLPRLTRAALKFVDARQSELAELEVLSSKAADNDLNGEERDRLNALRSVLSQQVVGTSDDLPAALKIAESLANKANELIGQLTEKARKK